jgi:hypothetical protein
METSIVKWWKNKWAVLLMVVGILSVVIGFLFAYFIEWGWILTIVVAAIGGIGMRHIAFKMIGIYDDKDKV